MVDSAYTFSCEVTITHCGLVMSGSVRDRGHYWYRDELSPVYALPF